MSTTELMPVAQQAIAPLVAAGIEKVLIQGDLAGLNPEQRLAYYKSICESVGLNPLTQPFKYINLSGKLVLYATKDCTEQLRSIHGVSLNITDNKIEDGICIVRAHAAKPDGRCDESLGAVHIDGLKGEAKANAMMKAETKAKRRVTLSICGLGMLDESEVGSIPNAQTVDPDEYDRKQPTPAQQQVAERKIAEMRAVEPAPAAPQPPAAPVIPELDALLKRFCSGNTTKYQRLSEFATLKKDLIELLGQQQGEREYYDVLRAHGVEKSDQFKRLGDAKAAIESLWMRLQMLRETAVAENDMTITDDDLPPEMFPERRQQGQLIDVQPEPEYAD